MIRRIIGLVLMIFGIFVAYGPGMILGKLGWETVAGYWGGRDPVLYSSTFMVSGSGKEIVGVPMYGILVAILLLGLACVVFGWILLVQKLRSDG